MAAAQTPSPSLYVGNLAQDITEALLFEIFNAVGPVASVRVCRDAATRRSLGYAYVNFHSIEHAERALGNLNFKNIRNKPCRIMWSHRDPSLRKSGQGNIFVKNLSKTIDDKALYDTFGMFGPILSSKVSTNEQGESLGYGFVQYESEDAANSAIASVNGKVIAGQKVSVEAFKSKKERGGDQNKFTNVFLKNIPEDVTEQRVREMFSKVGSITSLKVAFGDDGKSKGFGFINFETSEQAKAAVDLYNGFELGEKKLYVGRAQKREERQKELREKIEQVKAELQKKYEGVNLYVKNLSDAVDDLRLREEFKQFGEITSAKVMNDASGKPQGFGFVCFTSPDEASKAVLGMNGRMLDGKPLYVCLAQRKDARRALLKAQHNSRIKITAAPQMFPPQMQGAPMYPMPPMYQHQRMMYPQQNLYPQQQVPRRQQQAHPSQQHPQQMMSLNMPGQQQPRQQGRPQQFNNQHQPSTGARRQHGHQQHNGQHNGQPHQQHQQKMPRHHHQQQQQHQQGEMSLSTQLASATEEQKKQMLGERLYPLVQARQPQLAGKVTGMLLEIDNGELIHLLESREALAEKIQEAVDVLNNSTRDNAE